MKIQILLIPFIVTLLSLSSSLAQTGPPCDNATPPPGETACEATPICDFDGYCGRTLSSYTPDAWTELEDAICDETQTFFDCFTIENDSYLKFMASSTSVNFNLYIYDCSGLGSGAIQVGIFRTLTNSCDSGPVEVVFAEYEMPENNSPFTINPTGLIPGEVYYIVIDGYSGKDCGYTFEAVDGVALPAVEINEDPSQTICAGEDIDVSGTGGDPNNYLWSDVSGGSNLSSTTAENITITPPSALGTYIYTLESQGGNSFCPDNSKDTLRVIVEDCGTCPSLVVEDLTFCDTIAIDLNTAIDNQSGPATISFYESQTDAENSNNEISNMVNSNGSYWIRAEDPNDPSCFNVYEVVITLVEIDYVADITSSSCNSSDGQIELMANGGASPYTYSIDGGATSQSNGVFENLPAGSYDILITDNNGCETEGVELIGNADGPSIDTLMTIDLSCFGICDGEVMISISGGNSPYSIVWTDENQNTIIEDTNAVFDLCAGDYSVAITDDNGCSISADLSLDSPEEADASFTGLNNDYCIQDTTIELFPAQSNGVFSGEGINGSTFNPQEAGIGTHLITYIAGDVPCQDTVSMSVVVSGPTADFDASPTIMSTENTSVDFTNTSQNADSYVWDFGDLSSTSNEENPSHNFPNEGAGSYTVVLTASDENGCSSTKMMEIVITAPSSQLKIPNVFTPNGDGINDTFQLINPQNIKSLEVIILNRWGNLVFESNEVDFEWNGKKNNEGADCNDGTYFYKISFEGMDGKDEVKHGFVQLVKAE